MDIKFHFQGYKIPYLFHKLKENPSINQSDVPLVIFTLLPLYEESRISWKLEINSAQTPRLHNCIFLKMLLGCGDFFWKFQQIYFNSFTAYTISARSITSSLVEKAKMHSNNAVTCQCNAWTRYFISNKLQPNQMSSLVVAFLFI